MKVTLVYCAVGVAGFNANRPKNDREGSWIGHGIASVGAAAKAAGYEVELIDLRQLSGWEDFSRHIEANPSEVYGLSVAPVDMTTAYRAILEIKTALPQAKVIVGGIHPSILPELYDFEVLDTVVIGEGEVTFIDLLKMVEHGEKLPKQIRGVKPDLDAIPWIDRELFDYQRELDCNFIKTQPTPAITMLAGRGCPYQCLYCQPAENAVFGKPHRMRSVANVIGELNHLRDKYDFKTVIFWDDTFTFNPPWVMEFCNQYEAQGFKAKITACSRADIICNHPGMIRRMAEIGVEWLIIGMESGSQRLLDLIKKGTTVEQNIRAAEICREYGIKTFATLMYGLPTETQADSLATRQMIEAAQPDLASPFWFIPIPGTKLHDYCVDNEMILDGVLDRTIERTGNFMPTLKGVDYDYIRSLMGEIGVC